MFGEVTAANEKAVPSSESISVDNVLNSEGPQDDHSMYVQFFLAVEVKKIFDVSAAKARVIQKTQLLLDTVIRGEESGKKRHLTIGNTTTYITHWPVMKKQITTMYDVKILVGENSQILNGGESGYM